MDQTVLVQLAQGLAESQSQLQAFLRGQLPARSQVFAQRPWGVDFRIDALPRPPVVAQFHHVVEVPVFLINPHVQHVHKTFV